MAQSVTFGQSATAHSQVISGQATVTSAGVLIDINEVIPPSSTNLQLALAFAYLKVKGYCLKASAAMTLEFNNSSTGVPTVTLAAGQCTVWHETDPHAQLFTADVTTLYVTSSAGGTLSGYILVDPT